MADEHIVYLRDTSGAPWSEASRHADRDAAHEAMRKALATRRPGATARIDPGGELFLRGADGSVIEIMSD